MGVLVTVADSPGVLVGAGVPDTDLVGYGVLVGVRDIGDVGAGDLDGVTLNPKLEVGVVDTDFVTVRVGVRVTVLVGVLVFVGVFVTDWLSVTVGVWVGELVDVLVGVWDWDTDIVGVIVDPGVDVLVGVGVVVFAGDIDGVGVLETCTDWEGTGVSLMKVGVKKLLLGIDDELTWGVLVGVDVAWGLWVNVLVGVLVVVTVGVTGRVDEGSGVGVFDGQILIFYSFFVLSILIAIAGADAQLVDNLSLLATVTSVPVTIPSVQ